MDNQELNHAGIKGMKWGRRRWQNKDGSLTPAGKKRYGVDDDNDPPIHEDSVKARTSRPASSLSDKELADAILRKQREEQYEKMFAPQKSKGRKLAEEILAPVAKELAKEYTKKAAQGAINMGFDALGVKYKDTKFGEMIKGMGLMSNSALNQLKEATKTAPKKKYEIPFYKDVADKDIPEGLKFQRSVKDNENQNSNQRTERSINKKSKKNTKPNSEDERAKIDQFVESGKKSASVRITTLTANKLKLGKTKLFGRRDNSDNSVPDEEQKNRDFVNNWIKNTDKKLRDANKGSGYTLNQIKGNTEDYWYDPNTKKYFKKKK